MSRLALDRAPGPTPGSERAAGVWGSLFESRAPDLPHRYHAPTPNGDDRSSRRERSCDGS